jgi:hypothetical protein
VVCLSTASLVMRRSSKDRLKGDNSFVRGKGFTHQALAEPAAFQS